MPSVDCVVGRSDRGEIITLTQLISGIGDARLTGDGATRIEQLEYDSRLVKAGALFFAVSGYRQDGWDYVDQAVEQGAVAVMGERDKCDRAANYVQVSDIRAAMAQAAAAFYDYPGHHLKCIGVTGTNGKTTTCFLLKTIFETRGEKAGLVSSLKYDTGDEIFPAERTTPDALDLQRLLFLMRRHSCDRVVVEVSSHALVLHRVDEVKFGVGVFTNLTRDHLDFHEDMKAYARAKFLLADKLRGPLARAVINLDVEEFRPLFGESSLARIAYSVSDREADIYCGDYALKPTGTTLDLVTPNGTRTISLPLPGKFNLANAVAAAAGALAAGVTLDQVVQGLEAAKPVPGRLNTLDCGQPYAVYIDYAHTPDALARLCETVREITPGRLCLLFGCGGDRDKGKRPLMGQAATEGADYVVVTDDNPRSEESSAIIEDIKPGLTNDQYEIVPDRVTAIATILRQAGPGDAILLAGKGAENYQDVKGVRTEFSDADEASRVLADLGFSRQKTEEAR